MNIESKNIQHALMLQQRAESIERLAQERSNIVAIGTLAGIGDYLETLDDMRENVIMLARA